MSSKFDWKSVYKKIKEWSEEVKASEKPPDSRITPIFAQTCGEPVHVSKFTSHNIGFPEMDELIGFNFLTTLFKKDKKYYAEVVTYAIEENLQERALMKDSQEFWEKEKISVIEYMSAPNQIFDLKNKKRLALSFRDTTMSNREEFDNFVESWRKTS